MTAASGTQAPTGELHVLLLDLDNCTTRLELLALFVERILAMSTPVDVALAACRPEAFPSYRDALDGLPVTLLPAGRERDAAEQVLIDIATALAAQRPARFTVASDDHAFTVLADHGPVTVLSRRPRKVGRQLKLVATRVEVVPVPQVPGTSHYRRKGSRPTTARTAP